MILDGVYKADSENLQSIYDETLILSGLIMELQELSSAEAGTMSLNLENIELKELTDNIIENFRKGNSRREISLESAIEGELPPISGDRQKLKQVLNNILSNAYRFSPENGKIVLDGLSDNNFITLSIKDDGPGIEKDDLNKIFERFYRIDRSRKQGTWRKRTWSCNK